MTAWDDLIKKERDAYQDDTPIIKIILGKPDEYELEQNPNSGSLTADECGILGVNYDRAFNLWTEKRIYFTLSFDGEVWVESLPRHPIDDFIPMHIGDSIA